MQTLEIEKPVQDLVKLFRTCTQCEQVLERVVQSTTCPEFRGCIGRIRQQLNEFGFQLRAELGRIDVDGSGLFLLDRSRSLSGESCESSLRGLLEVYRQVLDSRIPVHTRAMLTRQYNQVQELSDELKGFVRVLQDLIA